VDSSNVQAICASIPSKYLQRLIDAFAELLESCPHLEFILIGDSTWIIAGSIYIVYFL
jgi:periodic tryptophan protein 2